MKAPDPPPHGRHKEPPGPRPPADPLAFISEDHLRERRICTVIDGLAESERLDSGAVADVLRFLTGELQLRFRDEAEDLFPLLLRRCTREDAIGGAIDRIRADQDAALRLMPQVLATLAGCRDAGAGPTAGERAVLTSFAGHVRRHLVAENAILLPIARARLTEADLRSLARRMRSRRGLPDVEDTGDAD